MPINKDFVLKMVGTEDAMIIPVTAQSLDVSKIFNVNETGAFIFNKLSEGMEPLSIAKLIAEEYDISVEIASADVMEFIEALKVRNIYYE